MNMNMQTDFRFVVISILRALGLSGFGLRGSFRSFEDKGLEVDLADLHYRFEFERVQVQVLGVGFRGAGACHGCWVQACASNKPESLHCPQ